jgi:phospholipid/cholesterol/gamma-HCH transport system permease protein
VQRRLHTVSTSDRFFSQRRDGDALVLSLHGSWQAPQFAAIEAQLRRLDLDAKSVRVEVGDAQVDLAGAWLLRRLLRQMSAGGTRVQLVEPPPALALLERTPQPHAAVNETTAQPVFDPAEAVEGLGRRAVRGWHKLLAGLDFIGRVGVSLLRAAGSLRRLRPTSVARHVFDTGVTALPIVSLIAFLISVILAYIGAQQLRKFGADIFVVDLVTIGMLREMGVLLTAIIVAGRSGSAFAAEIGAMELNEEIDALQAIGINPIEVLVVPRLLGLVIALPLLAIVADLIGLVGGGLLCRLLLDIPLVQYLGRVNDAIAPSTFWVGIVKAPVFAAVIATCGCYCGLRVRGSSRELGRLTTLAVVESIFSVILVDAVFAVLFMELDL